MNITNIFFSPSGTTKQVLEIISDNFEGKKSDCDLLYSTEEANFGKDDLVIVGMPIFAGRIPKTAGERLSRLTGDATKAIAVANYGNANIGDALLELVDLLKENNFDVIAAATTISHHSLFNGVAVGRPDESDDEKINDFAKKCIDQLESGKSLEAEIPGNRPYVDHAQLPFAVSCDDSCTLCNDCINICPENAISEDDPKETDIELCSKCTACISICPENSRGFVGEAFESTKPVFEEANAERKEPDFYF